MLKIHLFRIAVLFCLSSTLAVPTRAQIALSTAWRFQTGDDPAWAAANFDDAGWKEISPANHWESQGAPDYNGLAWYRLRFRLPATMRDEAFLKDSVRLLLGRIDDVDAVYLNGVKIGQTGSFPEEGYRSAWDRPRRYVLAWNDPALRWNADNVLAVRVYDGDGPGGFFGPAERSIGMIDLMDYSTVTATAALAGGKSGDSSTVQVTIHNRFAERLAFTVSIAETLPNAKTTQWLSAPVPVGAHDVARSTVRLPGGRRRLTYRVQESRTGKTHTGTLETPYILTPPEGPRPRLTTPEVYGARPGRPFLFTVTATGERPMRLTARGLPKGLAINPNTGIISGVTDEAGMFNIQLEAANGKGFDERSLLLVIGPGIALTPPLGWNSWNVWGLAINDARVRAAADALVNTGLAHHGWTYINIDDGWEATRDTTTGVLPANEKFPDMKGLADYVHARGLKLGIYSSPGPLTCGGYAGSFGYEFEDARTWADWGIDYLKYDWCSYGQLAPENPSRNALRKPYALMRQALDSTGRDIVYSLCQYGMGQVWEWGGEVGGNLWRTTGDITDTWPSMRDIGFSQHTAAPFARPGAWNDPDMLVVGHVGWGEHLHPTRLTPTEQYTHLSLWALLSAPLLIGCDLTKIDAFTYNLLANDEVLAINQDARGRSAERVLVDGDIQVWVKELSDGSRAVGIFNLGEQDRDYTVAWKDLGLSGFKRVRDVWRQQDVGRFGKQLTVPVYGHGVVLMRIY